MGVHRQPIFIDLIIKIMLCRVYANVMDRKLLTAEKILGNAEALLSQVEEGKYLKIVTYPKVRAESKFYHLDILRKKFLLQKGILLFSLNKELDA
jgi:hypothetical protein